MGRVSYAWLGVGAFLLSAPVSADSGRPSPVSPGSVTAPSRLAGSCPTFSWAGIAGATAYELAVYEVAANGELQAIREVRLPGGATSWTPSASECPGPGSRFAWTVRAHRVDGIGPWSDALLFETPGAPTRDDVRQALRVLRQYTERVEAASDTDPERTDRAPAEAAAPAGDFGLGLPNPLPEPVGTPSVRSPTAPAGHVIGGGDAALKVEGEVRAVDSAGEPRLWGRGRPNVQIYPKPIPGFCETSGIRFGLSEISVDWGSAADACPAGSWVCKPETLSACDTLRPDSTVDGLSCSGSAIDKSSDNHEGWTARAWDKIQASSFTEGGSLTFIQTCTSLPVWCCWD